MSRNRYTRIIHSIEDRQRARQEKELRHLARDLRSVLPTNSSVVPATNEVKERRQARIARKRSQKPAVVAAPIALLLVAALAACGVGSTHGELAENQEILASCDPVAAPASSVEIDGTGSSASSEIAAERMAAVEGIVRRTAICSGHLRVQVFSASSAATATIFDQPLRLDGATDNAKLKRVPQIVEETMAEIRAAYEPAVAALPGGGSDITAQYRLAAEWARQLDGDAHLHLYIFTDGFQNVGGVKLGKKALSEQEATSLAEKTSVPELAGASVAVAGLGRVAGSPPSSEVVEGLVSLYDALCAKTGAENCLSVTEYAGVNR
ncbi:hypothetical protein APR03_001965 [Promicromonospora thailandica]|uniref:VWFA domain-containing protein n=2 Tax=Promicromonospora thailandica TaxID=765201 RepID=A0A9X2G3G4_9MICO|nr:hypothetical protein [Promicromonospora thailandica]